MASLFSEFDARDALLLAALACIAAGLWSLLSLPFAVTVVGVILLAMWAGVLPWVPVRVPPPEEEGE